MFIYEIKNYWYHSLFNCLYFHELNYN